MGSPIDKAGRAIAGLIRGAPRTIRAYHGSPHSFSRFDASKIGTGEGAQAYGHGLYFAGNEDVAKAYRDALAARYVVTPQGEHIPMPEWITDEKLARDGLAYYQDRIKQLIAGRQEAGLPLTDLPDDLRAVEAFADGGQLQRSAHMYEVEIDYPEEALLDWDRPVGAEIAERMPPEVRRNVELEIGGRRASQFPGGDSVPLATGEVLYRAAGRISGAEAKPGWGSVLNTINDSVTDQSLAARRMLDAGIPGIRYLDQGSRSAGEGTRNYVMFPGTEDRIRILRQYGWMLPMAAAGSEE